MIMLLDQPILAIIPQGIVPREQNTTKQKQTTSNRGQVLHPAFSIRRQRIYIVGRRFVNRVDTKYEQKLHGA